MIRMENYNEEMQVASRTVNLVKVKPSKGVDLELRENHGPRIVSFSNKSCKRMGKDRNKFKENLLCLN